jgi:hypothetical protein
MAVSPLNAGIPNAPLIDAGGNITIVWRQFLTTLWNRTGAAVGADSSNPTLTAALAAETRQRTAEDISLATGIANETSRAQTAESALQAGLATEAALRAALSINANSGIDQERQQRIAADALLVPLAQLCALWAQCNLAFLPTTNPGHGLPWQLNGYVVLGIPPPAPTLGLENASGDWLLENGTDRWLWG